MKKRYEWIIHKGEKIIHADYTDITEEEYIKAVDEVEAQILREPEHSVLCLATIHSGQLTERIKQKAKGHKEKTKDHVKAVAAVGITDIKKVLVQLIYRGIHFAATLEEAKDWLVEQ